MMDSLWGEDFKIEETPEIAKKISKKINNPKNTAKTKGSKKVVVPLEEQMEMIRANVYRILGKYKDNTVVIKTKEQLNIVLFWMLVLCNCNLFAIFRTIFLI